jgi:hypothetical protein
MNNFGKTELFNLLYELDSMLECHVELIICGGAAGILVHNFSRGTMDIDILSSLPKLSVFKNACIKIAEKYGMSESWINDGAKGCVNYLPSDFEKRLIVLPGNFKNLSAFVLSRQDLLIMKLSAFRPEDIQDISYLDIVKDDAPILKKAMEEIAIFDSGKAHIIDLFLREKNIL